MRRTSRTVKYVALLIAVGSLGCASARLAPQALTMSAEFGPTCIGVADASGIRVWQAGRNALIPLPGDSGERGVLARDGTVLIARGFAIDLTHRPFTRRAIPIPHVPLA